MTSEFPRQCEFDSSDLLVKLDVKLPGNIEAISPFIQSVMSVVNEMGCAAGREFEIEQALREALHDPDPAVRQCAALGLRKRPLTSAIPDLIEALEDTDRLVARLASDALAAIGQAAIDTLAQAMTSPDAGVRIEAVRALANIDDPQAIPSLLVALNDTSRVVEFWAEQGLERLGVGMVFFNP